MKLLRRYNPQVQFILLLCIIILLAACGSGGGADPANGGVSVTTPTSPSALLVQSSTQSQVNLLWSDNATNETGFRLERKQGVSGTYSELVSLSENVISYSDTSVGTGETYIYRILAYNSVGNSAYSSEVTANVPGTPPDAPSVLSAIVVSASQIDLSWTDNSVNEMGFYLDRKKGETGTYSRIATVDATVTGYRDNVLDEQTHYFYRVSAYNLGGISAYSNEADATTGSVSAAGLWSRTYGGPGDSRAYSVINTSDGGFMLAGTLNLNSSGRSNQDIWLLKLKADETIEWQQSYGGTDKDVAKMLRQTSDGGYVVAGESASFNTTSASSDVWVLRLDNQGNIVWEKRYGFGPAERAEAIVQTDDDADGVRDDGFIVVGQSASVNGAWIIKLDSAGDVVWQQLHEAGFGPVNGYAVQQTADRGFIITGDVYNSTTTQRDLWVLKLATDGSVNWQNTVAGADNSTGTAIIQTDDDGDGTNDNGYLVVGHTDTDSSNLIQQALWAIKLSNDGTISWQKYFLGNGTEAAYDVIQTSSRGFLIAGTTTGFAASSNDFWLLHLLPDGSVDWEKRYGGLGGETAYAVQQATDSGYIVVGSTGSFTVGRTDIWALRLDASTMIDFQAATNGSSQATTATVVTTTATPESRTRNPNTTLLAGNGEATSATVAATIAIVATQSQ